MTQRQPALNVYRYTRLGRVLSWKYPSHRLALVASSVVGVVGFLRGVIVDGEWDFVGAFLIGVAVFLAWSCARELDPDRNLTAGLALVLAAPLAIWNRPSLLLIVVALQGLRLLAGTVGGTLQPVDYVAVAVGAAIAGSRSEGWGIVLLLTAAVLVARPRLYLVLAIGTLGVAASSAVILGASLPSQLDAGEYWIWHLLAFVAMVVSLRVETIAAKTDVGKKPLSVARIRAGRFFGGLAIVGGLLSSVSAGPTVLGPLFAALVSTAALSALGVNPATES